MLDGFIPSEIRNGLGVQILMGDWWTRHGFAILLFDFLFWSLYHFWPTNLTFSLCTPFWFVGFLNCFYKSSYIGRGPDEGSLCYSFTITLPLVTFSSITSGIDKTKVNLVKSNIINDDVYRIGVATTTTSSSNRILKFTKALWTINKQKRAHEISDLGVDEDLIWMSCV